MTVSRGMKIRMVAFVLAIAVIVISIVSIAHVSWVRTGDLREKLTSVQMESFRIADHFQTSILELNRVVLRFGLEQGRAFYETEYEFLPAGTPTPRAPKALTIPLARTTRPPEPRLP